MLIGLAALVNLLYGGLVGAIFFATGLIIICSLKLNLFTGKMGAILKQETTIPLVLMMLLGNLIGVGIVIFIAQSLANYELIKDAARELMDARVPVAWYKLLARGILCGLCVEAAVEGFKKVANPIVVLLPTALFILIGAHHCIADFAYYLVCGTPWQFVQILEVLVGNVIGGLLFAVSSGYIADQGNP